LPTVVFFSFFIFSFTPTVRATDFGGGCDYTQCMYAKKNYYEILIPLPAYKVTGGAINIRVRAYNFVGHVGLNFLTARRPIQKPRL
jgi:hypothetical protein